jgi:hypothetical protein
MRNRPLDLIGAAGLALAAVTVVWVGAPVAVCSILGVPLVMFAPGYVWVEVFFDSRLGAELRAVLSVALSLTITALGGVLLSVGSVRLDRSSWLALLAGMTLAGAAVAETSRARGRIVSRVDPIKYSRTQRTSVAQGVRLGMAGMLGAAALGIAVYSANAQAQPPYTQLSLDQQGPAPKTAQVVLGNHEHGEQHYRIVVSADGVVSTVWTASVAEGASWQRSVPARPGHRLAVDVYRTVSGGPPYRHVAINVPSMGAK